MTLGSRIAKARIGKNMTQTELAEKIGVSTEAVSKWERDAYRPGPENMERLEEALHLSWYDEDGQLRSVRLFNEEHMSAFLKGKLAGDGFPEARRALAYAKEKHSATRPRKGPGNVPYIAHPLTMACHALAMGLDDDVLLAALLLHDVAEECRIPPEKMPFCAEVREIVALVTKPAEAYDPDRYFGAIAGNPRACMVKCIDRCNNLSTMAGAFSAEKMRSYIRETEERYPELLRIVKGIPEYNNAAWLLKYQIGSLTETAKKIV